MSTPTDAEILAALKTAYKNIIEGEAQSVTVRGRVWTALNLTDLKDAIGFYENKIAAEAGGGATVAKFATPS